MRETLASLWRFLRLPSNIQLRIMRVVNDEFLIGLTGIIFNDKNEVLLFKHRYRKIQWSLPGGYLKAKEHPTEGLEREIQEESGLVVAIDEALRIRTDRNEGRLDLCYLGTFIGGEFKESDEVVQYGFFSFDNLPMILSDQVLFIKEALEQRKAMTPVLRKRVSVKTHLLDRLKKLIRIH